MTPSQASPRPADTPTGANGTQRRRRPCQHCGLEVTVEGGVAVDERHRRGRCAVQAIATAAHEQARAEAESDAFGVGGAIARFRF